MVLPAMPTPRLDPPIHRDVCTEDKAIDGQFNGSHSSMTLAGISGTDARFFS